jgi:NAD(P)-dependent dehydrogenase (short-subunit alcohol dehydrogenase family)
MGPLSGLGERLLAPISATVEERLAEVGIAPERVDYISYDHLHTQDVRRWLGSHGRPGVFPNAKLLVTRREWASTQGLLPTQAQWYCPNGIDGVDESKVILLDHDVLLGGSLAIVATPGHTEGNHSFVVRTPEGLMVTSENGVCCDAYAPLRSRIPGVARYARRTGAEVVLNGNTLESSVDQYISMVAEKTIARPLPPRSRFSSAGVLERDGRVLGVPWPRADLRVRGPDVRRARPRAALAGGRRGGARDRRPRRELIVSRVFVTGAASGIGRHLVGALDRAGHRVIAADLNQDGLAQARAREGWSDLVLTTYLDVTSETDWSAALDLATDRVGGVDVMMNVAGVLSPGFVVDVAAADIDKTFQVNVRGVVLGTREAARRMIAANIRGTSSTSARSRRSHRSRGCRFYCASKWAVRGFTLSAAVELEAQRISVSLVCPDAVETPMLDLQKGRAEAALTFSGSRPLTVDEVSRVVLEHVLPARPLEVSIPTARGLLARVGGALPAAAKVLYPVMKKMGAGGQKRSRGGA